MSHKKGRYVHRAARKQPNKRKRIQEIQGQIQILPSGSAHIFAEEGEFQVAPEDIHEAMDKDIVKARVSRSARGRKDEPMAYVVGVLHRASHTFMGIYHQEDPLGVVVPLDSRLRHDFFVLPEDASCQRLKVKGNCLVVARILEYPGRKTAGVATIDKNLGDAANRDINIERLIASWGVPVEFSQETQEAVAGLEVDAERALADDPSRKDVRDQVCFTIDPTDAKDFDDCIGAQRLKGGGYRLQVHIADVTHYMHWQDAIDRDAQERTCSIYLVDRVIPMIPEKLSNDLCSLRPEEDRLCMSVEINLNAKGEVTGWTPYKSCIRSKARFDYATVDAYLDGKVQKEDFPCQDQWKDRIAESIQVLNEVAHKRKKIKERRGAIAFESAETRVILDEQGHPVDISVRVETQATSLVEEAMLLANECVAHTLEQVGVKASYRVHEQPDPDALAKTLPVLHEFDLLEEGDGARICVASPYAIQEVLDRAKDSPAEYLVSNLLLRAQARAIYKSHNEGHYALGADAYCHFTSPIRRYPDDIVHRALKAYLAGNIDSKEQRAIKNHLNRLNRECSEKERMADSMARQSQKIKMAELYKDRIGTSCSGIISGVTDYGFYVMLDDTLAEGLVPIRTLTGDWYRFDELKMLLRGDQTGETWRMGQRVAVVVTGVNVERGQIDFKLAVGKKHKN